MTTDIKERLLPPLWVLTLIAALFIGWLIVELKEIVVLLVVGYSIAYLIDPVVSYLEGRKISRGIGVFVVFGSLAIVLSLLVITSLPTIMSEWDAIQNRFPEYVSAFKDKAEPLVQSLSKKFPDQEFGSESLEKIVSSIGLDRLASIGKRLAETLFKGYSLTLTLLNLVLLPFIVFYLAVDLPGFHRVVMAIFPGTYKAEAAAIFSEIDSYLGAFVRGQFTVGAILFGIYAVALGLFGIELWFTVAVVSGFGNIIPYFGFLLGIILSTVMTLITFGDFTHLLYVWGIFIAVQSLEGNFITPRIVGEKVGLSPLLVILAILAFGQLFGLLGVVLAVPLAAVTKVLSRHLHNQLVKRYN